MYISKSRFAQSIAQSISRLSGFAFLSITFLASINAHADGYVVGIANARCGVSQFHKEKNKFVKTKRTLSQFKKFKMAGKRLPKNDKVTVFLVEGDSSAQMFAVESKCVKLNGPYEPPKVAEAPRERPIVNDGKFTHRLRPGETGLAEIKGTYFTAGFMSWQEQISVTLDPTDQKIKVPVLATSMGTSLGMGFYFVKEPTWQMSWDSAFFMGIANLGDNEEDAANCNNGGNGPNKCYIGKNVQVWGFMTGPTVLWSHSQTLAAGFEIPVAFRKGQWPDRASDEIRSNNKFSILPMYLFTTHWRGENWGFVQKIGLMKSWPGYYWSLQVNRNF